MGVAYPCCDRCSDGLISIFFNSKKLIFAVFDDLFSTITNYNGSDVTSGDVTSGVISDEQEIRAISILIFAHH